MITLTAPPAAPAGAINFRDPASRAELAKELRRQLVADTAPGEHLVDYMAHFARLRDAARRAGVTGVVRTYSAGNMRWLAWQERRLSESHHGAFAGVEQWASIGRTVRPEAVAKVVWAPSVKTAKTSSTDAAGKDTEQVSRFVRFVAVEVYDYTDTYAVDGSPDPDWARPLSFGSQEILDALVTAAPLPVRFAPLGVGAAHGFTNGVEIVVGDRFSVGQQIATICHEWGHLTLGHLEKVRAQGRSVLPRCEQEAELVSYLTLSALGLADEAGPDLLANVLDYLRSWDADGKAVAGHKQREKILHDRVEAAWSAAETTLTALGR
jgi:hypothetical protein